mmetsp:Transcript_21228/g.68763  ORF Transcript_21228/g.68763 Transcript_21228/m.68763 type:complete len:262 (-) Transcript_21228:207-992(-)
MNSRLQRRGALPCPSASSTILQKHNLLRVRDEYIRYRNRSTRLVQLLFPLRSAPFPPPFCSPKLDREVREVGGGDEARKVAAVEEAVPVRIEAGEKVLCGGAQLPRREQRSLPALQVRQCRAKVLRVHAPVRVAVVNGEHEPPLKSSRRRRMQRRRQTHKLLLLQQPIIHRSASLSCGGLEERLRMRVPRERGVAHKIPGFDAAVAARERCVRSLDASQSVCAQHSRRVNFVEHRRGSFRHRRANPRRRRAALSRRVRPRV